MRTVNRSPEAAAFRQKNPTQELFTAAQPGRMYEEILAVGDTSVPTGFVVAMDVDLRGGDALRTFPDSRKEVFELRMKHEENYLGGVVYVFSGNPAKQLVIHRLAALPDGPFPPVYPELQKLQQAHPLSQYSDVPQEIERYETVLRVGP